MANKQVQQFITRMNKAIKDEGLVQLSGTRFDKGDTPMDALKAKAFGVTFMSGKKCSLGQVAADMNVMMDIMDSMTGKTIFKKRISCGIASQKYMPNPVVFKDYTD